MNHIRYFVNTNYTIKFLILAFLDALISLGAYRFFTTTDLVSLLYPMLMLLGLSVGGSYRFSIRLLDVRALMHIGINITVVLFVLSWLETTFITALTPWQFAKYSISCLSMLLGMRGILFLLLLESDKKNTTPYKGRNLVVYGVTKITKILIQNKSHTDKIVCILDENPSLHGRKALGYNVLSPTVFFDSKNKPFSWWRLWASSKHEATHIIIALENFHYQQIDWIVEASLKHQLALQIIQTPHDPTRNVWEQVQPLDIRHLLGRNPIQKNTPLMDKSLQQQRILITGGGGSIGGELCLQALEHQPLSMVLLDHSENNLYEIETKIQNRYPQTPCSVHYVLGNVTDASLVTHLLEKHNITTVFHAAAYKHVPIAQNNPLSTFHNNVWGTWQLLQCLHKKPTVKLVFISTDKAVEPHNIMGLSKRLSEIIICSQPASRPYCAVRFGNVLGSSGSVIPLFEKQIKNNQPITITDPKMKRFFMTIQEASQLVIQASALNPNGQIFILDMGAPICIEDMAKRMVYLSGKNVQDTTHPQGVKMVYIGIREGEKLDEKLSYNTPKRTEHEKIMWVHEVPLSAEALTHDLEELFNHMHRKKVDLMLEYAHKILAKNHPSS